MTGTPKEIEELEAAYEKATKGEWSARDTNDDDLARFMRFEGPMVIYSDEDCDIHPIADCTCNHSCREGIETEANARFIVLAHNSMPELIAAAKEAAHLRAELARVTAERDGALPWKLFYGDGMTLGEVADHFSRSIYAFSPWLTAPLVRSISEASEKANAERDAAIARAENARLEAIEEAYDAAELWGCPGDALAAIRRLLEAPADGKREG